MESFLRNKTPNVIITVTIYNSALIFLCSTILQILLNDNDLNSPMNWKRLADHGKQQDPTICCLKTHTKYKDIEKNITT
jgi:hypothetical protein